MVFINFKINSKAFFFTFAVILFASTLVFLTQNFSTKNVFDERYIISSYRFTTIPFITDDISQDLSDLLQISTSVDYNGDDLELVLTDSLSKEYSVSTKLTGYSDFLTNIYFKRTQGNKSIDFTNSLNGTYQIIYGDSFLYSNDYDTNVVKFISNNLELKEIDLNINLSNKNLINYDWVPVESSSGILVNINYFGDYNNFQITQTIDSADTSSLVLEFEDGVVDVNIGLIEGNSNSFLISSNISSKIDFSSKLNYFFDKNELPVYFDSTLNILLPDVNYSSLIKLK